MRACRRRVTWLRDKEDADAAAVLFFLRPVPNLKFRGNIQVMPSKAATL